MHWEVGIESAACPVSVITSESLVTIDRFFDARRAHKMGGVLYGADSSRWPARWFDAVTVLELEIEREEAAAAKAIHSQQAN